MADQGRPFQPRSAHRLYRACVGEGGCRIREVIERLDSERIDLVRWDDSLEKFIANALQPAEVHEVVVEISA